MKRKISSVFVLLFLAFSFLSLASEAGAIDDQIGISDKKLFDGGFAGMAVVYSQQPYSGIDDKLMGIPFISLEYERAFIKGTTLGYYFSPKNKALRFAIVSSVNFAGYDAEDSDDLKGMEDRDWGIDGGMKIDWKTGYCNFNLDILSDVSFKSEGQMAKLSVSKNFFKNAFVPRFGIIWQSADRVDYYYGVRENEVTPKRGYYSPDSDVEYFFGVRSGFLLTDNLSLMADVQANFLGKEAKDSPIVDKNCLLKYMFGISYRF
ncbi:MAG: MipA/OmpV family protein [Candidatus Omnitrophica bacterium]|nr:MipA/OmpV family protein [Candidatus Omnitrophota bacterium]